MKNVIFLIQMMKSLAIPVTFVVFVFISGIIASVNMLHDHNDCLNICVNK